VPTSLVATVGPRTGKFIENGKFATTYTLLPIASNRVGKLEQKTDFSESGLALGT